MNQNVRFKVDPRLAKLLGESYRSSEQALKELVDNAFDADSKSVHITLPAPMTDDPIIIRDTGSGMTSKELEGEYLTIASDRRSRKGDRTPLYNRLVKGRKGIGKFAGLMAADTMLLETSARGVIARLKIRRTDLLTAGKDLEKIDLPLESVKNDDAESGTTITLSNLSQNLAFPNPDKLKQLLILEYGRRDDFKIFVNGDSLDISDLPGETFTEEVELPEIGKVKIRFTISDSHKPFRQSGIAIRVGDKIIGKTTYFGLEDDDEIPNKLLKMVYGEVEAEGLTEDDVTADWGAIIENSIKFKQIQDCAGSLLKEKLQKTFYREVNLAKARLQQQIDRELEKIPAYRRESARLALDRIMKRFFAESADRVEAIVFVVLEAFERDEYWTVVKRIEEARHSEVEIFAEALKTFGLLDMSIMANQVTRRLGILGELDALINNPTTLEKTMHEVIESNLKWILGIEYSLMSSNATLKNTIEKYKNEKFTGLRANKRPDLFLCEDYSNRHLLIEFKRPSHSLNRKDENQAEEYRDDLTRSFGKMEILVLGGPADPKISAHYERPDVKIMSYSDLISRARTQLRWLQDSLGVQKLAA